ncbi:hypothetical protein HCN44_003444 [Aphidius gifuensis]|uniref:Uncharacterized protein n=2 Tax=Aphidius gifuensis TaxID=684658 RepID=A0A834XIK5_APHGI|nr:hypothetical protein HCN44_003444 [Aphidius gifuensis]
MLRQLIICSSIIIGLRAVITAAEPVHRSYSKPLINENTVTIDCSGNNAYSSECLSIVSENNESSLPSSSTTPSEIISKKNIEDMDDSWSLENLLADGGVTEARKKKKKGMGRIFIMMVAAAKATLMYVALHATALLAGKAFVIGKIALVLATVALLKKSSEHHDKSTYEIVKHPQHSYVQTHSSSVDYDHPGGSGSGGYDRRRKRSTRRS